WGSPETASPSSILITCHGTPWRSRYVAKYPGASVTAQRNIATGFIDQDSVRTASDVILIQNRSSDNRSEDKAAMRAVLVGIAFIAGATPVAAADVNVIALTAGKAVVIIDKGKARTLAVGETSPEGVKLISATSE